MIAYSITFGIIGFLVGGFVAYFAKIKIFSLKVKAAESDAEKIIQDAQHSAEVVAKEAELTVKDKFFRMKNEFDSETKEAKAEIKLKEKRILQNEVHLDRKIEQIDRKEKEISQNERLLLKRDANISRSEKKYHDLIDEQKNQLEKISGLTSEQAKDLLIRAIENEARFEGAKLIKRIENESKLEADKRAKKIISTAIQRYSGDFVAERTVSVVQLPSDDMKGRIIGREGRNIRAIEAATGIDLIIDDTPEAVIMSGFNPVRREIARLSLLRLISDGRIHPARIEDVVKKVTLEVDLTVKEAGEHAVFDLEIHGIHSALIDYIGRLKYRTSYAQNVLQHSIEVGFLCGMMAAEIGFDQKLARRIGLLHDIGKAVDHEVEGSHALIGANIAEKYGEIPVVVHAIAAHHEDIAPTSAYDLLLQSADSLSGARPGARKELLENYIKRLDDLEKIANSFKGVANSYAIQAGREIRVIVESSMVSDEDSVLLSRDIVKKIEELLTFPGQIKVTVIRETRSVEYANK